MPPRRKPEVAASNEPFCGREGCRRRCTCVPFHLVGIGSTVHIDNRPAGPRPKGRVRGTTRCGKPFVPSPALGVSRNQAVWLKCAETCSECWQAERALPATDLPTPNRAARANGAK